MIIFFLKCGDHTARQTRTVYTTDPGLPLIFYLKFPDFFLTSLTFHHFPDIFDGLPAPLQLSSATKSSNRALTFREKNNHLTKEWSQFCKFMLLEIKETAIAISVSRKVLNSLTFPWLFSFFFQFPWLKPKFPDFSLNWKKFHFPDFFPWPWQPWGRWIHDEKATIVYGNWEEQQSGTDAIRTQTLPITSLGKGVTTQSDPSKKIRDIINRVSSSFQNR